MIEEKSNYPTSSDKTHFRWVDDISNFNVMNVALDSSTGYILEDLEYPQHLHAHADLPTRETVR